MCAHKIKLDGISYRVIKRLPSYRAALADAVQVGKEKLSSTELAAVCGGTASQVRQDLGHFGSFGQQGYGYVAKDLLATIDQILGIDAECHLALVGVGQLGRALLSYSGFLDRGFRLVVAFDSDPELVGQSIGGVPIYGIHAINEQIFERHVEIGIITVPKTTAQSVADALTSAGVRGIWNFAPLQLKLPEHIAVERVNLVDSLMTLAFQVKPRAISLRREDGSEPAAHQRSLP